MVLDSRLCLTGEFTLEKSDSLRFPNIVASLHTVMSGKDNTRALPAPLRNSLRGVKDPYAYFSLVRREISPSLYPALAAWIPNLAQKHFYLTEGRYPASLRALRRERRILQPVSCTNEILWAAVVLRSHTKRLADFVHISKTFQASLLAGNYEEADFGLYQIQRSFGYSFWLIQARLALLQAWKGLEAQKAFVNEVKEAGALHSVYYVTYVTSQRNEDTTNPHKFKAGLKEESVTWNVLDEFRDYILFHTADIVPTSARTLGGVLRVEGVSPIIDQYETFVRLASHALALRTQFALAFAVAVQRLDSITVDARLRRLLFLAKPQVYSLDDVPIADSFVSDHILAGDYESAASYTWPI
jgi:hypothetical protein